jgi:hypothetical protein
MDDESAKSLRRAASSAHRRGDTDEAIALFEAILDRFPGTPEAIEARFYLSGVGGTRRRKAAATVIDAPRHDAAR